MNNVTQIISQIDDLRAILLVFWCQMASFKL